MSALLSSDQRAKEVFPSVERDKPPTAHGSAKIILAHDRFNSKDNLFAQKEYKAKIRSKKSLDFSRNRGIFMYKVSYFAESNPNYITP